VLRAIGRYMRALGYLVTGRIDAARQELSKNPYVVQATFDRVIEDKTSRIHQYKDAVAAHDRPAGKEDEHGQDVDRGD
jgi:hypothetical protein